ncbi:GMC oxidoreductase-domain-containing protein [Truncatella angustata]|uniref:GMC oxidoreductase-domain-containing protein n=1 Tax=Truncatella angustata TaxID=152316 RepID=A0A9P8RGR8_9PEZI|nr:GMC oxidoreductase-domain-containing protein [Truncatella angustata]KAH6645708.1 GMC oxidoreductase-domain-containing protein [Truncatella angustata]
MGLRWNRNLVGTSAMRSLNPAPDMSLISENHTVLEHLVKCMVGTGFHPCGTAAMLPRENGGVVDVDLKVYGVRNLRVIDSSIIPLIPSAHLQSVVYALAEKVDHSSLSKKRN